MENRSHALLAGLFTLALLVAAALVAIWVGRDRAALKPYVIVSATSVSGLSAQSTVRYQGVPVGKVQSLGFNPDKPAQVRISIGVAPDTPITESTWAELGVQGVTGLGNIELRDDGTSTRRLASSAAMPATIPLRPGFFQRFEQRGGEILHNVEQVSARLERLLSNENVLATTATLQNIAAITTDLRQAATDLRPALAQVPPLVDSLQAMSRNTGQAAQEIAGLAQSARHAGAAGCARWAAGHGHAQHARYCLGGRPPRCADPAGGLRHGQQHRFGGPQRHDHIAARGRYAPIVAVRPAAHRARAGRAGFCRIREVNGYEEGHHRVVGPAAGRLRRRPHGRAAGAVRPGRRRGGHARLAGASADRAGVRGGA